MTKVHLHENVFACICMVAFTPSIYKNVENDSENGILW